MFLQPYFLSSIGQFKGKTSVALSVSVLGTACFIDVIHLFRHSKTPQHMNDHCASYSPVLAFLFYWHVRCNYRSKHVISSLFFPPPWIVLLNGASLIFKSRVLSAHYWCNLTGLPVYSVVNCYCKLLYSFEAYALHLSIFHICPRKSPNGIKNIVTQLQSFRLRSLCTD